MDTQIVPPLNIVKSDPETTSDSSPQIKEELEESSCDIKEEITWFKVSVKEEPLQEPTQLKRNFTCEHCTYITNWKGNLTKHKISRHTNPDEIQWLKCDHCEYKGKTRDYLKGHLLHVHNVAVKWLECPHCSFKAKTKSHLKRHVVVNHTTLDQIKWVYCELCSYKTKFRKNLKEHVFNKHTESTEIQWYHCEFCSFKTKRKRDLQYHQLNKHTDDDKIPWSQCEFCPVRCKRKSAVKVHVKTVHGCENKKTKVKTKEIPVFINDKLCWRRVVVDEGSDDCFFDCSQCFFRCGDKEVFRKHILKEHVVTEFKQDDDWIVKTSYKTKDVVVIVDDVPCIKKIVEHALGQNLEQK